MHTVVSGHHGLESATDVNEIFYPPLCRHNPPVLNEVLTATKLVCLASLTVTMECTSSISFCFSSSSKGMYHLARRVFPARFWIRIKRIWGERAGGGWIGREEKTDARGNSQGYMFITRISIQYCSRTHHRLNANVTSKARVKVARQQIPSPVLKVPPSRLYMEAYPPPYRLLL